MILYLFNRYSHFLFHHQIIGIQIVLLQTQQEQYNILQTFYNTNNGENWVNNNFWLGEDINLCSFYGITCDRDLNVIKIELRDNNLTGLLYENLFNLEKIQYIDLGENYLTSTINSDILNAKQLTTLILDNNQLSGQITNQLCQSQISFLDISNNQLNAKDIYCTTMRTMILDNNIETGVYTNVSLLLNCAETQHLSIYNEQNTEIITQLLQKFNGVIEQ